MLDFISCKQKLSEIHSEIGGKAKNLFRLKELGINVPDWIVIPNKILSEKEDDYFKTSVVIEAILNFFNLKNEKTFFAVRSSGIDEDGTQFSFAGQFETFLYVTPNEIGEKIIAVKQSATSERVRLYREKNGLSASASIAVIVQKMLNPEISGVAFGIDPATGDENTKIISSVYGVGEGIVSGLLDADTYKIKEKNIESRIVNKKSALFCDFSKGGVVETPVNKDIQDKSSLNEKQIFQVCEVLQKLTLKLGKPQDIEFAFEKNTLYLLQTRPVTAVAKPKGEYTLWDNSNIIESYPGVTTPLTFSFIIKMYEAVYRQFVGLLGLKENEINKHSEVFANTLGLIRGRVYYNLLNWYKMLAMVPGYSINAQFMENMMGVKERFELKEKFKMNKSKAGFRIIMMIFKMFSLHRKLPKERENFMKQLNSVMSEYEQIDFKKLTAEQIKNSYISFEQNLLKKWKAPLINDFFAMIWFGVLQKLSVKYKVSENINVHNDLLCGSSDIISTQPIHRSIKIADMIRANPKAKEIFENKEAGFIYKQIQDAEFKEIMFEIKNYLHDFGERCIGELKLESISYSGNPELFISILKSYIKQGITSKKISSNIEAEIRSNAEKDISNSLKNKFLKRKFYNYALRKTRELVSNRENLRYERTRGFGMVRKMFSEIGNKLFEEGKIENARDIFLLEQTEIFALIDTDNYADYKQIIRNRKIEFETYANTPPHSERFFTYGNNFADAYIYSQSKLNEKSTELKGIGCCPGLVKAKVRVVMNPAEIESLNGDILVTSSTDPGWVTLFPTASGIIVERGSLLSHSAIVSREMGIPCIVSVSGLLASLKTGDEIIMNGSTGTIIKT